MGFYFMVTKNQLFTGLCQPKNIAELPTQPTETGLNIV